MKTKLLPSVMSVRRKKPPAGIVLYHGTSKPPEKIREEGLVPGRHSSVFLTDNPDLAGDYAQTDQDRTGNHFLVIVSVHVQDLDQTLLYGDIDESNIEDWQESLRETDQCMYRGPIPANVLTIRDFTE